MKNKSVVRMPNRMRLVCSALDELRTFVKTLNISRRQKNLIRSLAEEIQTLVNRMETALWEYKDFTELRQEMREELANHYRFIDIVHAKEVVFAEWGLKFKGKKDYDKFMKELNTGPLSDLYKNEYVHIRCKRIASPKTDPKLLKRKYEYLIVPKLFFHSLKVNKSVGGLCVFFDDIRKNGDPDNKRKITEHLLKNEIMNEKIMNELNVELVKELFVNKKRVKFLGEKYLEEKKEEECV